MSVAGVRTTFLLLHSQFLSQLADQYLDSSARYRIVFNSRLRLLWFLDRLYYYRRATWAKTVIDEAVLVLCFARFDDMTFAAKFGNGRPEIDFCHDLPPQLLSLCPK